MAQCKQCGVEIKVVPGKVQKQFCGDAHRKAYKRAELRKSEVTGAPSVDELRTMGTKLSTSDNSGQPKRGKDIKCFADLPADVQERLNRANEIRSQQFIAIGKPGTMDIKTLAMVDAGCGDKLNHNHFVEVNNKVIGKPGDADYNGICTPEWRAERGR